MTSERTAPQGTVCMKFRCSRMEVTQTVEEGEPVVFSSGAIEESGNDPATVAGIAAIRIVDGVVPSAVDLL